MTTDERFERLVRGVEGLVTLTAQLVSHFDGSSVARLHEMAGAKVEQDAHLARAQVMDRPALFAALKERGVTNDNGEDFGGKTKTHTLIAKLRDSYADEAEKAAQQEDAEVIAHGEDEANTTAPTEEEAKAAVEEDAETPAEEEADPLDDEDAPTAQYIPPMEQLRVHLTKYCAIHGKSALRTLIQEKIKPDAMKFSDLSEAEKGLLYLAVVEVIGAPGKE